jgi:hypothetical protein
MLTFFGGNTAIRYDNLGKAEKEAREKNLASWGAWMEGLLKAKSLEAGYPLQSDGKRVDSNGIQDYHFPDTTEGGFIVIKAESPGQAALIALSSPIIDNGGYVLVRPCGELSDLR